METCLVPKMLGIGKKFCLKKIGLVYAKIGPVVLGLDSIAIVVQFHEIFDRKYFFSTL